MDFCPACTRVYVEHHEFCSSDGTPLVAIRPELDPLVGLVFDDRYELVRVLGAGGNGVVYVAKQVGLERVVAFKMMYAERMKDERALKRFAREARALASLDHPGCVRVLDYRAAPDSVPYLVMELVEGYPLSQLVGLTGIAPQHAVLVALRVAEAVDAAHRAGIVHRDLKPENVILDVQEEELRVRLIDFGLALVVDETKARESRLTAEDRVVGTPEYMSPEQIKGVDADVRTDLYALGVMLYELLTGLPPFSATTPASTLAMHLDEMPPHLPLRGLDEALADEIRQLFSQLMEKQPENRPRDAEEVAQVLRALHARLPDAGPELGIVELPSVAPNEPSDTDSMDGTDTDISVLLPEHRDKDPFVRREPEPAPTSSGWTARRLGIAIAIASLVSVMIGVAVGLASMGSDGDGSASSEGDPSTAPTAEPTPEVRVERAEDTGDDSTPTSTLPTAGTVEMPGGQAQSHYETALRALGTNLSERGLRPRDVRSHPRGMAAWTAQSRAASSRDYAEAAARIGELAALAGSKSEHEWMVYRLQRVQAGLGESPAPAAAARMRALWSTLDRSSASSAEVRRWMRRVDALEGQGR